MLMVGGAVWDMPLPCFFQGRAFTEYVLCCFGSVHAAFLASVVVLFLDYVPEISELFAVACSEPGEIVLTFLGHFDSMSILGFRRFL